MASQSEKHLCCPICYQIFQEPVLLLCSHSFCKNCLQRWWTQKRDLECPLCKRKSLQKNPPLNLALKNLCEDLSLERTERPSTRPAALYSLPMKNLFSLDHQQPLSVIRWHSQTHNNTRTINGTAQDNKKVLRELLKPVQEKLELFKDIKGNFDQTAQDIEVQAQDTERQIKEVFSMLQNCLRQEEQARIGAVREEKKQKSREMKRKSEALSKETEALSDIVRATEDVLRAEDVLFLQRYNTAAEIVQNALPDDPQPVPGALIDMTKHLDNLSLKVLDSMRQRVTSTLNPQNPAPTAISLRNRLSRLRVGEIPDRSHSSFTVLRRSVSVERIPFALSLQPNYQQSIPPSTERIQLWPAWTINYNT